MPTKRTTKRKAGKKTNKRGMRGGLLTTGIGFNGGPTVNNTTGAKVYNNDTGQWEEQTTHQVGPFTWKTQAPPNSGQNGSTDNSSYSTPTGVIIAGVIIIGAVLVKIVTGN